MFSTETKGVRHSAVFSNVPHLLQNGCFSPPVRDFTPTPLPPAIAIPHYNFKKKRGVQRLTPPCRPTMVVHSSRLVSHRLRSYAALYSGHTATAATTAATSDRIDGIDFPPRPSLSNYRHSLATCACNRLFSPGRTSCPPLSFLSTRHFGYDNSLDVSPPCRKALQGRPTSCSYKPTLTQHNHSVESFNDFENCIGQQRSCHLAPTPLSLAPVANQ